jgi:hypothetical protein
MKTLRKIHGFMTGQLPIIELSGYEVLGSIIAVQLLFFLLAAMLFILPCLDGIC